MTEKTMLSLKNLTLSYKNETIIKNINFEFGSHKIYIICGRNGIGKSTLLKSISGEIPTKPQHVIWQKRRVKTFFIPQTFETRCDLTVSVKDILNFYNTNESPIFNHLKDSFVPLKLYPKPWDALSGGERLRILLTCSFLANPDMLLLDEPLNHLDEFSKNLVIQTMGHFLTQDARPRTIIAISHDLTPFRALNFANHQAMVRFLSLNNNGLHDE
ncbi:MAG: ABC transporter ATP-binding protein [Silvanigrellaceae bacterium]|nr:ABC transporter ATP-binding protein [Silvanigrellaceae bacterium]